MEIPDVCPVCPALPARFRLCPVGPVSTHRTPLYAKETINGSNTGCSSSLKAFRMMLF
jgi:hypothetical protein